MDGFSIRGGYGSGGGGGINVSSSQNINLINCKIFDNQASYGGGIFVSGKTAINLSNCTFLGNQATSYGDALRLAISDNSLSINMKNCIFAGHIGNAAILASASGTGIITHSYTNCTFANNILVFYNECYKNFQLQYGTINFSLKNSIIYGNSDFNQVYNSGGTYIEDITYSLVQGVTSGTGNLDGTTTNPQFVNPTYTDINNAGDYRLKWCSKAIGAGTNVGISPLDLDRNPRNFGGTTDMGAFEFLGNLPSQVTNSNITGTIDSPTYAGGAIQTITSSAKILAPAGAIDFKAPNSITLNPGFEARGVSQYFKAQIGPNSGCSN